MNAIHPFAWHVQLRAACVALFVAVAPFALATERPPMGGTPTVPGPRRDSFDWQGFVGGLMQGSRERPTRRPIPPPPVRPPVFIPERRPVFQPEFVEPSPELPPTVTPPPNIVRARIRIPQQDSPLVGRVSEVSTREAQAYAGELANLINTRLTAALGGLPVDGAHVELMQKQGAMLREMMSKDASWKDMEPVLKELLQGDTSVYPPKVIDQFKQIAQLFAARDAFRLVAQTRPRARSGPLPIAAIPIGLIWILFDPGLAAGTGLLVSDTVFVAGTGGAGELHVGYESVAAALGLPTAPGEPVPDVDPTEAATFKNIILICHREDTDAEVNYVLNGRHSYAMKPGHKQKLPADKSWRIDFDRGNNQGTAQYELSRGVYEFRIVDNRWDLVRVKFDVTIDNEAGVTDFKYVVNDQVVTVKAGEKKSHESSEPLVVTFDRGEGIEHPAAKNLNKSGTYKVAVNTQSNYLDLFAASGETETSAAPGSGG